MKRNKKIGALILCALIAGTMTVSMTACGSSSTTSSTAVSSNANNATLEAYLKDNQSLVDSMKSGFASSGADSYADCEVAAENGNLILTVTYNQQVTVTADALKNMESAMDAQKSTMTDAVATFRSATGLDDLDVIVRYLNKDGSEILTATFTDSKVTYTEGKTASSTSSTSSTSSSSSSSSKASSTKNSLSGTTWKVTELTIGGEDYLATLKAQASDATVTVSFQDSTATMTIEGTVNGEKTSDSESYSYTYENGTLVFDGDRATVSGNTITVTEGSDNKMVMQKQ